MQMLSPARPSPSRNSKLGDLLRGASAGSLEALQSPWLVALPAQDDEAALWDSSAISSHCLQPASCGQFRCYSTPWYLLVFGHSFGNELPLEYFTHLWNFFFNVLLLLNVFVPRQPYCLLSTLYSSRTSHLLLASSFGDDLVTFPAFLSVVLSNN